MQVLQPLSFLQIFLVSTLSSVHFVTWVLPLSPAGRPHVRPMGPVSAVAGETFRVQCPVAGFPITSITWAKGKKGHTHVHRHPHTYTNQTRTWDVLTPHYYIHRWKSRYISDEWMVCGGEGSYQLLYQVSRWWEWETGKVLRGAARDKVQVMRS